MTIHFYLNNEEETQITSFHDLQSNPFAIGDVVILEVDELYPAEYRGYNEHFQNKVIEDNQKLKDTFNRKKVKIVREGKYMDFKLMKETRLTIEYHCEFVD